MAQAVSSIELELQMTDAVNASMAQIPDLSVASFCTCGQHGNQSAGLVDVGQPIGNNVTVHEADDRLVPFDDLIALAHEPDGTIDFGATPATTHGTSGVQNTDALVRGLKWVDHDLTYSFPDSWSGDYPASYPVGSSTASFNQATAAQQVVFGYWFDQFAEVSGLSFSELDGATGALDEDQEATIKIARDATVASTAFAYYPSNSNVGGDIWLGNTALSPVLGTYSHHQIGHEIGHAVGLKHGHETTPNGAITAADDSIEYSIMTYRSFAGHNLSTYPFYTSQGYSQTLMTYDIAALQFIYGANFNTNSGDTTYTFSTTTGAMSINGVSQGTPFYDEVFRTLWDGDGVDTYDLSNYITDLILDLTPGSYSDFDAGGNFQRTDLGRFGPGAGVEMARGHLFNALQYQGDDRSLIENAIGGSGDDSITGNAANNVLTGNGGDDTMNGGAGNDLLNGGDGDDLLIAGTGNDTLNGEAGDDRLRGNSGLDQMFGGDGNDRLDGASGGDIMSGGNGIDTVEGEGGNDTVNGDAGDDIVRGGGGFDVVSGGTGNDRVEGNSGNDIVNGDDGNDEVTGGGGNDSLDGGTGDDTLNGNSGDDSISGGTGNDSLLGSVGDDTMDGGTGADTFIGGRGNDIMTGGADVDIFVFASNAGADQITDFEDNIDILSIDDNLYTGTLTAADIVSTFGSNIAGGVELDFGGGDVIEVLGAGVTTASIVDDILIV